MSIINTIKSVLIPESWCCAYRYVSKNESILTDKKTPFILLDNSKKYWCADPFPIEHNGKIYLFFEMFDRTKRKGVLGYREIDNDKIGELNVIWESNTHLSFPFIYEENDSIYIMPESVKSHSLYRIKATDFPNKWEFDKTILDRSMVDSVLFENKNNTFLLTQIPSINNPHSRLDMFYYNDGEFIECINNPVKEDAESSRGAGKIFEFEGKKIRPSQDCGAFYGEFLNFNEIVKIDNQNYQEKLIEKISVSDLNINSNKEFIGIHTYNRIGNFEVIDLKIPAKFNFLNAIGAFRKLITGKSFRK